jgi:hypothetical protein
VPLKTAKLQPYQNLVPGFPVSGSIGTWLFNKSYDPNLVPMKLACRQGAARHCSPCHMMPIDSRREGLALRVNDVTGNVCQALGRPKWIRATPPPILGDFRRVESGFWVTLLTRRIQFWV